MSTSTEAETGARATVDRLVSVTIDLLEEHGEAGLRVEDVLAGANASASSMYHHFENRDGLIDAARVVVFTRQTAEDIETIRAAFHGTTGRDDLLARFDAITRALTDPERRPVRLRRTSILGWAAHRPSLWAALGEEQRRVADSFAALVAEAQDRGLVRDDVEARAIAEFVLGYGFGRVLGDLDAGATDPEEWCRVVDLVVRTFVLDG